MIQGQRRVGVGLAAEDDQANAVAAAAANEVRDDGLGGLQPIGDQVALFHRARHVECDDDVDPFQLQVVLAGRGLRPRQGQAEQRDAEQTQRHGQVAQA